MGCTGAKPNKKNLPKQNQKPQQLSPTRQIQINSSQVPQVADAFDDILDQPFPQLEGSTGGVSSIIKPPKQINSPLKKNKNPQYKSDEHFPSGIHLSPQKRTSLNQNNILELDGDEKLDTINQQYENEIDKKATHIFNQVSFDEVVKDEQQLYFEPHSEILNLNIVVDS